MDTGTNGAGAAGYGQCESCAPQCAGCDDCLNTGYGDRGLGIVVQVGHAEDAVGDALRLIGAARSSMRAARGGAEPSIAIAARALREAERKIAEAIERLEPVCHSCDRRVDLGVRCCGQCFHPESADGRCPIDVEAEEIGAEAAQ